MFFQLSMAVAIAGACGGLYLGNRLTRSDPNSQLPAYTAIAGGVAAFIAAEVILTVAVLLLLGWIAFRWREEIFEAICTVADRVYQRETDDDEPTMTESMAFLREKFLQRIDDIRQLGLDAETEEQAIESTTCRYQDRVRELSDEHF